MTARKKTRADSDMWLSTEQLSQRWGIAVPTLYKMRARGVLPPATRLGKFLRWRLEYIEEYELDNEENLK